MNMKHLYIIVFILVCCQYGFAQKNNFSSENEHYFASATLKDNGALEIEGNEDYSKLEQHEKRKVLERSLKEWEVEIIFVHFGYIREIWKKDLSTGIVSLIGSWDLNNPEKEKYLPKTMKTTKYHPWFVHGGLMLNFSSDDFRFFINTRIGFFLLKNRWDIALSASLIDILNGGYYANAEDEIVNVELGLVSKVYFPIKKIKLSPYVGAGISRTFDTLVKGGGGWNYTALVGASWYIGHGSLDLGVQVYKNFNLTLGYTFVF